MKIKVIITQIIIQQKKNYKVLLHRFDLNEEKVQITEKTNGWYYQPSTCVILFFPGLVSSCCDIISTYCGSATFSSLKPVKMYWIIDFLLYNYYSYDHCSFSLSAIPRFCVQDLLKFVHFGYWFGSKMIKKKKIS